ncbi:sugar ABC transporter ATP-binding protein [Oscillospiraceae bacterium PP1C4]
MSNNVILEMRNIEKRFSGVYALKGVNLVLEKGEVHALLGENGAGKSTLIKVLGGIHASDGGEIYIDGQKAQIDGITDAQAKGISIIHQEIVLVPHISVAENIFLGREPLNKFGLKDTAAMNQKAQEMVSQLGLDIDVTKEVFYLTIAHQQLVEIVKAVSFDSKIIVMDEPTSSLTEHEVEQLFKIIRNLKAKGVGVIYISHKLNELFEITDKITVMRDGEYVDTKITKETDMNELIALMVGRELKEYYVRSEHQLGDTALEAKNLARNRVFEDISFHVSKGEIVGFAGLVGAGRSEIMKAVFGIDPIDSGVICLEGKQVAIKNVQNAMANGIAFIPEDRKKEGLILKNTVAFNMTLTVLKDFIKFAFVNKKKKSSIIDQYIKSFSIKTPSTDQLVSNLSGGNQQKVVLAKWLATKPKVLILDEPTRGVDVGAKSEIYAIIDRLANEGMAVIIISSELPEIVNMCDRVYVMAQGRINGELRREEFSQEKIMYYATGGKQYEYK